MAGKSKSGVTSGRVIDAGSHGPRARHRLTEARRAPAANPTASKLLSDGALTFRNRALSPAIAIRPLGSVNVPPLVEFPQFGSLVFLTFGGWF